MIRFALLCVAVGGILVFFASEGSDMESKRLESSRAESSRLESKPAPKPCLYVRPSGLNLRESPSVDSKIQGKLAQNTRICEYSKMQNGFLQTPSGWVFAEYLALVPKENFSKEIPLSLESQTPYSKPTPQSPPKTATNPQKSSPKILITSRQKTPKEDSLKQAREFLAKANYKSAKTLALRANQENPQDLESWEVFATSLYLEGKKAEAIRVLEAFLQSHYNENLWLLLEKMQKDRI